MREPKFRVWSKKLNKYVGGMLIGQLGLLYSMQLGFEIIEEENDDYEVEQYTGLNDKNGKEIYEGDIVKHETLKDVVVYVVVYSAKHAGFALEEKGLTYYMGDVSGLTVVGNIHENERLP